MKRDAVAAPRVLLVDDNLHGITARKLILTEHGYDVQTALSGEEAWELFGRSHFDIVVTDFRMTGMDGVELIGLIRASDSPARTILLSGFVGYLGLTEKSTGADQVICKSAREVQDLLRGLKRLAAHPPRRAARPQGNDAPKSLRRGAS